eukprot:6499214-Pyramimonas_sp.AAC.1
MTTMIRMMAEADVVRPPCPWSTRCDAVASQHEMIATSFRNFPRGLENSAFAPFSRTKPC